MQAVEEPLVWRGPVFDKMASDPCTISLLAVLAACAAPAVIVEAGAYIGHTSISIALNLKLRGIDFHLWTADSFDYYIEGFTKALLPTMGLEKEVTFYLGDFEKMLEDVPPIDFAYIDASHKDEPTMRKRHFDAAMRKANKGAIICIDDCAGDWPHSEELRENANLYLPNARGLAIYQNG